ncbi:MFS transporter [Leuconostoc carnosum]|uniref:MFS transporter n=1 Tax=Leuconostoc carnosum TaxID=1252 RepID=UPI00123C78D4|nr:MFS transporter [Leuconostoc carnosum]KAA8380123.1 MFS transporter [Leuconostoc carnosum]
MFKWILASPDASFKVPDEKVDSTFRKKQLGVLIATSFSYIAYYIIRLVFTTEQHSIMNEYSFSISQVGLILSTFGIGYGVSKLFMGALSDKANTKYFLVAGLYLSALFNAGLAFTRNFYVIIILMLLMSSAQSMGAPACQREISLWFSKKNRGTAYAIWSSAHNAGAFLCVMTVELGAYLFNNSLAAIFLTASVVSVIIGTLMLLINSESPAAEGLPSASKYDDEIELTSEGEIASTDKTSLSIVQVFIKYILMNKIVWAVALTSMAIYIIRYGIMSWIPSYLPTKGFSPSFSKWLVGIFEIAAVPGVIVMGMLSDKLKGQRALVCLWCLLGLTVSLMIYFFSTNQTLITIDLFFMGSLIYAPATLIGLMINEAVPKFAVGVSTGFIGFFQYVLGEVGATALIGILVDKIGWKANSLVIFVALGVIFILTIYLVINDRRILKRENNIS